MQMAIEVVVVVVLLVTTEGMETPQRPSSTSTAALPSSPFSWLASNLEPCECCEEEEEEDEEGGGGGGIGRKTLRRRSHNSNGGRSAAAGIAPSSSTAAAAASSDDDSARAASLHQLLTPPPPPPPPRRCQRARSFTAACMRQLAGSCTRSSTEWSSAPIPSFALLLPAGFAVLICSLQDGLAYAVFLTRRRSTPSLIKAALTAFALAFPLGAGISSLLPE